MRLYRNMRIVFSLLIVFVLASTLNTTPSFAQQAPQMQRLEHPGGVRDFAYSPDSATLATGGQDGKVRLWDVATGTLRHTLEHPNVDVVYDVAFSPDGTTLASANDDWKVRLWDVATGTLRRTLIGHSWDVLKVTYSPDGTTLATAGGHSKRQVHIWDAATGALRHTLDTNHSSGIDLVYSPDSATLVTTYLGNWLLMLWDVATGTLRHHIRSGVRGHEHSNSIAYSPDGGTVATAAYDGVRLWDAATGTLLHTLPDNTWNVAYSPDSRTLISGGRESAVRVWDVATGTLIDVLRLDDYDPVRTVAYSPDGTTFANGQDEFVYIWDAETRIRLHKLRITSGGEFLGVKYSPDGTTLTGSTGVEGSIGHRRQYYSTFYLVRLAPPPPPIIFTPSEVADQTFTVGTPVSLTLPFASGGTAPYTYTLAPLPNGLQLNSATRELSGTPLTPMDATSVTYTATDATGRTADLTFTMTVIDAPTTGITFAPSVIDDLTLPINTPMTPVFLPLAQGGTSPYTYTLDPIPAGLSFDTATQLLSGTPTAAGTTAATYTATDAIGASGSLTFSIEVTGAGPDPLDVNGNGQVNVVDLILVAAAYGEQGTGLPADVNADGIVNIQDLIAVAAGIDASGTPLPQAVKEALLTVAAEVEDLEAIGESPRGFSTSEQGVSTGIVYNNIAAALTDVRHLATGDVRLGKWMPLLENLLQVLAEMGAIPEATALLPNYPNPFNPETWIPYHLATDAEVTLTIHDVRGSVVRELTVGHQPAGVYESRTRAVYWDGKNALGESVASGVYFYTLTADDFTATRKLLIAK